MFDRSRLTILAADKTGLFGSRLLFGIFGLFWFCFELNGSRTGGLAASTASARFLVATAIAAASCKAVDMAEAGGSDMALELLFLALPEFGRLLGLASGFLVVASALFVSFVDSRKSI